MAVNFMTNNPTKLLADFKARIAQTELKGKITTWEKDADGDFTHKAADWHKKAWLRPVIGADRLTFTIVGPQGKGVSSLVYAYYHGHVIETFLNHFDQQFTNAQATALPAYGDQCNAAA